MGSIPQEGLITHEDAAHMVIITPSCIICSHLLHIILHHATQQNRIDCLRMYHNATVQLGLTFSHTFRSQVIAHFVQPPLMNLTGHVSLVGG